MTHRTVSAIAADIERYLAAHPLAADTVDGVQRWWLSDAVRDASVAEVEQALQALEQRGVVTRRVVFGGSVMFSARAR